MHRWGSSIKMNIKHEICEVMSWILWVSGVSLWKGYWTFESHKMLEVCWLASESLSFKECVKLLETNNPTKEQRNLSQVVLCTYHKLLFTVSLPCLYISRERQYNTLTVAVVLTPLSRTELTEMYMFVLLVVLPVSSYWVGNPNFELVTPLKTPCSTDKLCLILK
jgi:hypothetical protein